MFTSFRQSTKDVLRNVLLMVYGGFVFLLPQIMPQNMPDQTTITVVQVLGGVVFGQGFLNIISIWFGIDSNRSLINKLDEQAAHIQALEYKLTTTNNLLQQLVDNSNQPTISALQTPVNAASNTISSD